MRAPVDPSVFLLYGTIFVGTIAFLYFVYRSHN